MTQKEWLLNELEKVISSLNAIDNSNLLKAEISYNKGVHAELDKFGRSRKVFDGVRTLDINIIYSEVECLK